MKRIVLFLVTNLAVGLVLTVVLSLFGVNQYLAGSGLNVVALGPMVGELDAAIHELRPKTDAPAGTNGERRTAEGG